MTNTAEREPVTILYFAWMRERVGLPREALALPDGVETVAALSRYLAGRSAGHAMAFKSPQAVRCAVNQEFADPGHLVRPGDEVAFFPPMTGG